MRSQACKGFSVLSQIIQTQGQTRDTVDRFCERFLQNQDAIFNGKVMHLFLDRAHLEAALEQDTTFCIGGKTVDFQDIFRVIVQKVSSNPENYPPSTVEQLCMRFKLVENDLQERFGEAYREAQDLPSFNFRKIEDEICHTLEILNKIRSDNYALRKADLSSEEKFYTKKFQKLLRRYQEKPFDSTNVQFLQTPIINAYLQQVAKIPFEFKKTYYGSCYLNQLQANSLNIWLLVEQYLRAKNEDKSIQLKKITTLLEQFKVSGSLINIDKHIIKNIYLTGDQPLIALVQAKCPTPAISDFDGGPLPKIIRKLHDNNAQVLESFLIDYGEEEVFRLIDVQRRVRARIKKKEDLKRLLEDSAFQNTINDQCYLKQVPLSPTLIKSFITSNCYIIAEEFSLSKMSSVNTYWYYDKDLKILERLNPIPGLKAETLLSDLKIKKNEGIQILSKANKATIKALLRDDFEQRIQQKKVSQAQKILKERDIPYVPQCTPALANRIVNAVKEINLYTTIRHRTSEKHIANILDGCLLSQYMLTNKGMDFVPGAIDASDVRNGDAKSVFFGLNEIHSAVYFQDTFEIVLYLDKIKSNPCTYVRQRDPLVFSDVISTTSFFNFSQSRPNIANSDIFTFFELFKSSAYSVENIKCAEASIPLYEFTSSNLSQINQILILNFFKFLDKLVDFNELSHFAGQKCESRLELYKRLASLSHEELVFYLREIGLAMSQTAEVDFYGAFTIDFSAVYSFKSQSYELVLSKFIANLQSSESCVFKLEEAIRAMPEVFKSYRFVKYLLLVPDASKYPQSIVVKLEELLSKCHKPTLPSMDLRVEPEVSAVPHSHIKKYDTFTLFKRLAMGKVFNVEQVDEGSPGCGQFVTIHY